MDKNGPVFPCPHCGSRHTELSRASLPFLPEWLRHLLPVSGTCPAQGRIILICKDCGKRCVMYIM